MIQMTKYERAKLLLQAFQMFDGWGKRNENDIWIPASIERRKELAVAFVEWATTTEQPGGEG